MANQESRRDAAPATLTAPLAARAAAPPHRNRSLDRLRAVVADAGARTVLCTDAVRDSVGRYGAEAPDLQALRWLATDAPETDAAEPYADVSATPQTLAFLQYTSGS